MGPLLTGAALIAEGVASAGGAVLAGATRAVSALRASAKPLHPAGVTRTARIHRHGSDPTSGVRWLDEPGEDEVLVRVSRAVGLPDALPDIHGLAIRVQTAEGEGDLLLASTGWGRLSRFVLTASRDPSRRPMTTLLPYRTSGGAVLLGARAMGPASYTLSWAPHDGDWQTFGVLILNGRAAADQGISFDPVRRQIPGLGQYPAVTRLREPAYHRARASSVRESEAQRER